MKALQLLMLFSIILLSFTTCKRYPEGGWSNVAIKHLFGGHNKGSSKTWHLKKYEVNGIDSTIYICPDNGVTSFENDEITLKYNSALDYNLDSKTYHYGISFSKRNVSVTFNGGSYSYGSANPQCFNGICERSIFNPYIEKPYAVWKIVKLKTNEFIIITNYNNNNYKISLTS